MATDSKGLKGTNVSTLVVYNPSWLYFDPMLAPFLGYINVWDNPDRTTPPPSGSTGTTPGANFGFAVAPTSLLRASMANGVITLQPNTYVFDGAISTMNPAYINADGSSAGYFEQDYYIGADFLQGQTLTFAGFCPSNSLDSSYTAVAWIKDMNPDYSVERRYDAVLVAGQPFSVTTTTHSTNHVQYGFALYGPCNSATNPITQGAVQVVVYSPLTAVRSGNNISLSFPTVVNHSYVIQYKSNLTDASWTTLSTTTGTGVTVTVTDPAGSGRRFYRLMIQ